MRKGTMFKITALGILAAAVVALFAWGSGAPPRAAEAGGPPSLPPLISCPNVDGGDDNRVLINDVSAVIQRYRQDYPALTYAYLYDSVDPYNFQSPSGTGQIRIGDVSYVIQHYRQTCSALETQIAKATRAIGDPTFTDKLCDDVVPLYTDPAPCGGTTQFLTEDASFLATKGYRQGSSNVPGQGTHYLNYTYWNGVFNPVRPPGLVYDNGQLTAQLYYAAGDSAATVGGSAGVGWASSPTLNTRAVNLEALPCTPVPQEPPSIGACSWSGTNDGWHWHANLCTYGIGTTGAWAIPSPSFTSEAICTAWAASHPSIYGPNVTCTYYPTANYNCAWTPAAGWMSHLWNWLPNGAFTNAVTQEGFTCETGLCSTGESSGRFADCYPDTSAWNAYNCPQ